MFHIGIVNQSTIPFDLEKIVATLQLQVTAHFNPIWGVNAKLAIFPKPERNWWNIFILDTADQQGVEGYHDETDDGLPQGFVYAKSTVDDGGKVSVTLSHELLELLADPMAALGVQVKDNEWWAYEVCDPVENSSYQINGIDVSDFVLPSWFNPYLATARQGGAYDYLGRIRKPLTLDKGGYIPVYRDGQWTQIFGSDAVKAKFNMSRKHRLPLRAKKFAKLQAPKSQAPAPEAKAPASEAK